MNNDFKTILEFLDRCGPEVSGHSAVTVPPEKASRLKSLAAGKCKDNEVLALCEELRDNPAWIRWLAEQVKENRPSGAGSAVRFSPRKKKS